MQGTESTPKRCAFVHANRCVKLSLRKTFRALRETYQTINCTETLTPAASPSNAILSPF